MERGELSGKTAIVTGAGRGWAAMALGLLRAGGERSDHRSAHSQKLTWWQMKARKSRRLVRSESLQRMSPAKKIAVCGDRNHPRVGSVHILVNNAGGNAFRERNIFDTATKFWQTDPAVWRMSIDTMVNGPFLMAREVTPHMLKQRLGPHHQHFR